MQSNVLYGGTYACDAPTLIESGSFDNGLSVILKHTKVVLKKKYSVSPPKSGSVNYVIHYHVDKNTQKQNNNSFFKPTLECLRTTDKPISKQSDVIHIVTSHAYVLPYNTLIM